MPRRVPSRPPRGSLPDFGLYGEARTPGTELLHIEPIQQRSRQYDWEIDAHVHHGLHQVVWLLAGPVTAVLDDARVEARGPLAIVIPPGVAHAFRFSAASDGHVLTVDARLLADGDASALGPALQALFAAPRVLAAPPDLAPRWQVLFAALQAESPPGDAAPVAAWLARALVWRLAEQARADEHAAGRSPKAQAAYTRFVVLLEAHYREHWPVSRYAERLGLGTEPLNRMLRGETGRSAQALIHARLVREASRRLVHVAAPVSRLAYELGFDDPAYFCRFFKRHTGASPRAFRARAQRG